MYGSLNCDIIQYYCNVLCYTRLQPNVENIIVTGQSFELHIHTF